MNQAEARQKDSKQVHDLRLEVRDATFRINELEQ